MIQDRGPDRGGVPEQSAPPPSAGATILVVDDEHDIRTVVRMCLESEGYRVRLAADGRRALELILAESPAAVLLDLNMPLMTGQELLAELRARQVDVPVLFMSAAGRASAEAARCGAAGWVPKPFDLDDLLETVARATRAAASPC